MASPQLSNNDSSRSAISSQKGVQDGNSPLPLLGIPGETVPPPSPGVLRMLKTTTELGDIESLAMYGKNHTHKVSQFPREPRSLPKMPRPAGGNVYAPRPYSPSSAPTYPVSQRTTPSSQGSSHNTGKRGQKFSRVQSRHRRRSYSLTQAPKSQTGNRGYSNLVYPGKYSGPIRPRHLLGRPTQLERFGYRPSSPSLSEFTASSQKTRNFPDGKATHKGLTGAALPIQRQAPGGNKHFGVSRIPRLVKGATQYEKFRPLPQPYIRSTARHEVAFYESSRYHPVNARSVEPVGFLLAHDNVVPPPLFYDYSERFEEDRRYLTGMSTPSYTSGSADQAVDESKTSSTSERVYCDSEESSPVAELSAEKIESSEEEQADFLASSAYLSALLSENDNDVESKKIEIEEPIQTKEAAQKTSNSDAKPTSRSDLGERRRQWRRRQALSHLPRLERGRLFSQASSQGSCSMRRPKSSISWHEEDRNAITWANLEQLTRRSRSVSKPYWRLPSVDILQLKDRRRPSEAGELIHLRPRSSSKASTAKRVSFDVPLCRPHFQEDENLDDPILSRKLGFAHTSRSALDPTKAESDPVSGIAKATLDAEKSSLVQRGSNNALRSNEMDDHSETQKPTFYALENAICKVNASHSRIEENNKVKEIPSLQDTLSSPPPVSCAAAPVTLTTHSSTTPETGFIAVPQQLEESAQMPFAAELVAKMEATLRSCEPSADIIGERSRGDATNSLSSIDVRSNSPPESRPWNLDESYPWSSDGPTMEVTLSAPSPVSKPRDEQPKEKSKVVRSAASTDDVFRQHRRDLSRPHTSDQEMPTLMEFLRSNAADESPQNFSLFENFQRRLALNSSDADTISSGGAWGTLGRPVSRAHSPGDRYPTTGLAAPSPPLNIEDVRSFFSDDSSQIEPRNSLKKRITHLRAKLPTSRSQSTDDIRGYDRTNTLLHPLASRSSAGAATTGHGPVTIMYAYDGTVGMSNVEYRAKKAIGRLKFWWHRGGEIVRELRGTKSRPMDNNMLLDMGA
ncbi:hypothetical protein L228DRAFT_266725 [Xylona heveae TC161]|uniref:Uncharacterized protein n=1 Tax=Xylona heveae (strain CBS 132557 / TC161) TaxID=1328760 RepID=A0A165I4T4_XYLHT|nr:hypothetical protein L228DRAFT_266725 [Xylona heveae TC161]KZF24381.1 hypothetical protein L228DRAFT_266725 [Xylona heveae TC161]